MNLSYVVCWNAVATALQTMHWNTVKYNSNARRFITNIKMVIVVEWILLNRITSDLNYLNNPE